MTQWTNKPDKPGVADLSIFRFAAHDGIQAAMVVEEAINHKFTKIAILHDNTAYGKGLADETKKAMNKAGVQETLYIAYVPGEVSPTGQPQLLLAKEGNPRELSMIGDGGKGKPLPIKLEKEVRAVCADFSAVTIDPKTGHMFISSDESATVAQIKLVRDGDKIIGKLVQSFPVRNDKGEAMERIEGLSFNEKGDLFVLTENNGKLHQLDRK